MLCPAPSSSSGVPRLQTGLRGAGEGPKQLLDLNVDPWAPLTETLILEVWKDPRTLHFKKFLSVGDMNG